MSTTIAGHTLTDAERRTLNELTDYMLANAGDSHASNCTSPKGDGRRIPLLEIFPRSAQGTASRRTAWRLEQMGVLKSCELRIVGGQCEYAPL